MYINKEIKNIETTKDLKSLKIYRNRLKIIRLKIKLIEAILRIEKGFFSDKSP